METGYTLIVRKRVATFRVTFGNGVQTVCTYAYGIPVVHNKRFVLLNSNAASKIHINIKLNHIRIYLSLHILTSVLPKMNILHTPNDLPSIDSFFRRQNLNTNATYKISKHLSLPFVPLQLAWTFRVNITLITFLTNK